MKQVTSYFILNVLLIATIQLNAQHIRIDPLNSAGAVSGLNKPGIFLVPKTTNGANDFVNNGIHHNTIRLISLELAMEFSEPSIESIMSQLEASKSDIEYVNSRCDKLILTILKMPLWLSSSTDTTLLGDPNWRKFNAMPPANYATWSLLMDSIVSKINDQWGLDPYYEIWNEPDNFYWQASPDEYFNFFKKTYFAIKTNHPTAKVGGPVLSSFTSKFGSAYPVGYITNTELNSSIMARLIDSCVSWNAPLDFISWHKFDSFLYSVKMEVEFLNQKLVTSGHGIVPYFISEWNNAFNIRESAFAAAFMPNYLLSMENLGISGHVVAGIQDFIADTSEFHHDYGMLSWGALQKPEWKSLLLLNKIKGEQIKTDSSDVLNLAIVSSMEHDTVRTLFSNRCLDAFTEATSNLLYNKHFNVTDIFNAGYTSSGLDSIYKGLITIPGTDSLSLAINSVIPIYQKANAAFHSDRTINLTIAGLNGIHTGKMYLIDSTHNNVIYQFDSLLTEGYSRADATDALYPNTAIIATSVSITDSLFSFHIQPNAVMLLEFYVPGISGISDISTHNQFDIFPNPVGEKLTINLPEQYSAPEQAQLYNSTGTLINTFDIKNISTVIDVSTLPNGAYLIRLKNKEQRGMLFIKQ